MSLHTLFWKRIFPVLPSAIMTIIAFEALFSESRDISWGRLWALVGGATFACGLVIYAITLGFFRTPPFKLPQPPTLLRATTPLFGSIAKVIIGISAPVFLSGVVFKIAGPYLQSQNNLAVWSIDIVLLALFIPLFPLMAVEGMQSIFWKKHALVVDEHALSMEGPISFQLMWKDIEDLRYTRQIYSRSSSPAAAIRVSTSEEKRLSRFRVSDLSPLESNEGGGNLVLTLNGYTVWPENLFQAIHTRWDLAKQKSVLEVNPKS